MSRIYSLGMLMGVDPELFITTPKNKQLIPAERYLPFKDKPIKVPNLYSYPSVPTLHADGLQAEITTSPTHCRGYISGAMSSAIAFLNRKVKAKGHILEITATKKVPKRVFEQASPQSIQLGCDPENIAHLDGMPWCCPVDEQYPFRFAGGHIHLGFSDLTSPKEQIYDSGCYYEDTIKRLKAAHKQKLLIYEALREKIKLIKILDIVVGSPCVLLDNGKDSTERRKAYGLAGAYRPKIYGVEYRVLSNFWIKHPVYFHWVLGMARMAAEVFTYDGLADEILSAYDPADIIQAINLNDVKLAENNWNKLLPFFSRMQTASLTDSLLPMNLIDKIRRNKEKLDNTPITQAWPGGNYHGDNLRNLYWFKYERG